MEDLPAIRDRLSQLSSSGAADARGKRGALPGAIRRLHGVGTVAGPATTARCAPGAVSAVLASLEQATAGQILVAQALSYLLAGHKPAAYGVSTGAVPSPAPTPSATPSAASTSAAGSRQPVRG